MRILLWIQTNTNGASVVCSIFGDIYVYSVIRAKTKKKIQPIIKYKSVSAQVLWYRRIFWYIQFAYNVNGLGNKEPFYRIENRTKATN